MEPKPMNEYQFEVCGGMEESGSKCAYFLDHLSFHPRGKHKGHLWYSCNNETCENYQDLELKNQLNKNMEWANKRIQEVDQKLKAKEKEFEEQQKKAKSLKESSSGLKHEFENSFRAFCRKQIEYYTGLLHKTDIATVSATASEHQTSLTNHQTTIAGLQKEIKAVREKVDGLRTFLDTNRSIESKDVIQNTAHQLEASNASFHWSDRLKELEAKNKELTAADLEIKTKLQAQYRKGMEKHFKGLCEEYIEPIFKAKP